VTDRLFVMERRSLMTRDSVAGAFENKGEVRLGGDPWESTFNSRRWNPWPPFDGIPDQCSSRII